MFQFVLLAYEFLFSCCVHFGGCNITNLQVPFLLLEEMYPRKLSETKISHLQSTLRLLKEFKDLKENLCELIGQLCSASINEV